MLSTFAFKFNSRRYIMGAAKVRDFFARARDFAPCIVFIDEIDAVGKVWRFSSNSVSASPVTLISLKSWMGNPAIRKYAKGPNTQKYPILLSPPGAKRRKIFGLYIEVASKYLTLSAHTEYANTQATQIRSNIQQYHTPPTGISHPSLKPKVYLLKDRDLVGLPDTWSARFLLWTVLIGRSGFDTISSLRNPN